MTFQILIVAGMKHVSSWQQGLRIRLELTLLRIRPHKTLPVYINTFNKVLKEKFSLRGILNLDVKTFLKIRIRSKDPDPDSQPC